MEGGVGALFGRAAEERALRDAIANDRSTVVVGEAGIGKSSLVRAAAGHEGRLLREGGGLGTLRWTPYLALRRALGATFEGDPVAVAGQVERLVGPDLLFVDDLQWADDATWAATEILAARILVVAAVRTDDALAAAALAHADRAGLHRIELGPLGDVDAAALLRHRAAGLSATVIERLVRQAGGNPLVLEELATGGDGSPAFARSVARRFEALDADSRATVELLAIVAGSLDVQAAGAGVPGAIASDLAVEHESEVAIRHDLVAAAILDRLTPAERAAAHARAAGLVTDRAEQVRHLAAAGERAAAAARAEDALAAATDPRERAALLAISAEVGPESHGLELRLAAARELDELSEWGTIARLLSAETGANGADADAATELLTERDAVLAHAQFALGHVAGCRTLLATAATRDIPPGSAAAIRRAIETATFMVNVDGAIGPAIALLDAAATHATDDGDAHDIAILRDAILLLASGAGSPDVIGAGFEEAFAAGRFRTATDRARVIQYLLLMGASSEAALEYLLGLTARYEAAGLGSVAVEFNADAVVAAVLAGQLARAVTLADELLERPAPPRPRQTAEIARAQALTYLGRLDEAEAALDRVEPTASPDWFGRGLLLAARAEQADWSGRARVALELIDASLATPAPISIAHVTPAVVRASIRAELGLDPGPEIQSSLSPSLGGAPHELDGHRLAHSGDETEAAAAFDRAAVAWAAFHAPRAHICRWAAGDAFRRAGDRDAAVARLSAALEAANDVGFEALAARIRRSLRQAGVRSTGGATERPVLAGGLTARERELVALVERGLTNIEIARRLGLGRPTVARILSSAMSKLGVESRQQLAARIEA